MENVSIEEPYSSTLAQMYGFLGVEKSECQAEIEA
jgi:hypothetical protein